MPAPNMHLWYKAPFLRLIFPFIAGILIQWHGEFSFHLLIWTFYVLLIAIIIYQFLPLSKKFIFSSFNGVALTLLIGVLGTILTWIKDIRHNRNWIGNIGIHYNYLTLKLQEPLVEKPNSYKAISSVEYYYPNNTTGPPEGNVIVYFKKDSLANTLVYGSIILIQKPLQEIRNSGNPGSFDYKRYSLFQSITHQVYLTQNDFISLPVKDAKPYKTFLFHSRRWTISVLRKYITGDKEQGLAEALLIGYKDDLDKNLVQSYSNTGVVHVIAISGLHLGIIYWLLLFITKPLKRKQISWLRFIIIIAALWGFSFLAGAQPSVLRSALMFTAIALSTVLDKRTSIYNTLAMSAFLLLCYNPFWLWDVGFQLSYAAVLSIIVFFKPIYNWLYFPNKAVDFFWKLIAVSLAAQILTLPISLYHFHQFPFLFLFANLLAVPLSSLILIGEILLCALHFLPPVATALGHLLKWMIQFMNHYILQLDNVSFAVWDGISISAFQAIILTGVIAGISYWLIEKKKQAFWFSIVCLLLFITLRTTSFIKTAEQKKIIVYNVPKYAAIDIIDGRRYRFIGDDDLEQNEFLQNFHIRPSRVLHRTKGIKAATNLKSFQFYGKQVVIIDTSVILNSPSSIRTIDLLVLSKNPKIYIKDLRQAFNLKQIVLDGSVPSLKAKLWQKDCDSLRIPCYDVSEKGAFVMNL
jgi:competence protein ComEC